MPINYRRRVDCDHDGHVTNQCLRCYQFFIGNAEGWRFCPLCGTEWVGSQQESERLQTLHEMWWRQMERDRNAQAPVVWVIRYRDWSQWPKSERRVGHWHRWMGFPPNTPVAEVLAELKRLRTTYTNDPIPESAAYFSSGREWEAVLSHSE